MSAELSFLTRRAIAHRGLHDGNKAVPENTLAGMMAAAEAGYAIELDVQLSSDGMAMVFHDETLERLCNRADAVASLDTATLSTIPVAGTSQTILPLADILASVAGRVPVIVEMKDNGAANPILAKAVARDLALAGGEVAAMSFAHDLVAAFIECGTTIPCGLTAEGMLPDALAAHHDFMDSTIGQSVRFISYNVHHLPNAFITTMREERGLPVITWTVRNPDMKAHSDAYADQITFEGFVPDP